jgi:hypothetical protein
VVAVRNLWASIGTVGGGPAVIAATGVDARA